MNNNNWTDKIPMPIVKWIAAVLLVTALGYIGYHYPLPEPPTFESPLGPEVVELGTSHFTNVQAEDVTVTETFYPSFTDLTVSDGDTITPTYTTYALDSAGAVTITLAATGTQGQLLILIGDDANDVTINDTNTRTNDGAAQVIGQYDVIMWVYQDSEWLEVSESNDS